MELSKRIKQARHNLSDKLGYAVSQGELGKLCGFGNAQSRISNYETGQREPSLEDLLKIIAVTGARPAEFFESDELEGMDLGHVERAMDKVAADAAIPKSLFKTRGYRGYDNSITPFLLDPEFPFVDGNRDIGAFYPDRDTGEFKKSDVLLVDLKQDSLSKSGTYMVDIAGHASITTVKLMPNGMAQTDEFGEQKPEDFSVIGRVICKVVNT